jgi:hypothetical protein
LEKTPGKNLELELLGGDEGKTRTHTVIAQ